jgi:hypothetical protein
MFAMRVYLENNKEFIGWRQVLKYMKIGVMEMK